MKDLALSLQISMNILLMSMPDITSSYPTQLVTIPNLALPSIAGSLDKKHKVKIADLVLKRKNIKKAVVEAVSRANPRLIGLSAMTFQYPTALKIAKFLKSSYPGIQIALGGYHATTMYEGIAAGEDGEYFDFIFRGESELSFNETINKLEKGEDLRSVAGLSFKEKGTFIHNRRRELADLSSIKLPDRSARLWNKFSVVNVPIDAIEYSRGCKMSCNFCSIRSMYGKSFRTFAVQRVMQDIENVKRAGARILFFADDNITTDTEQLEHLCEKIIQHGHNDMLYGVQASSTGIASSQRLAKKMARAGFKYVFLGIESGSEKNLEALDKGNIVEKSRQAVRYLHEAGIMAAAGIIIGSPADDADSIEAAFKFTRDLKVEFAEFFTLVPYPKTRIREQLLKKGLVTLKDDYRYYNHSLAVVRTERLSSEELDYAKFKSRKKYIKSRYVNSFRAFMKNWKQFMRLRKGAVWAVPGLVMFMLAETLKYLCLSRRREIRKRIEAEKKLNEFNI